MRSNVGRTIHHDAAGEPSPVMTTTVSGPLPRQCSHWRTPAAGSTASTVRGAAVDAAEVEARGVGVADRVGVACGVGALGVVATVIVALDDEDDEAGEDGRDDAGCPGVPCSTAAAAPIPETSTTRALATAARRRATLRIRPL